MNKEEAIAYAKQLLKDSGASDEEVTQAVKLFEREKFAQGFIPRPEVDRALDSERGKYRDIHARNEYLEKEWLPQAKTAYEKNLKGIAILEKYQQLYGPIDDSNNAETRHAAAATGLSEEKIRELLKTELDGQLSAHLSARDQATLDLMEIREDYMDRFKKRLPLKDFEKAVTEARKSGSNDSLTAIYKNWIDPDVRRIDEANVEARIKQAKEEAVRDFASRNRIPVDSKPKEPHLLFDRQDKSSNNGANGNGRKSGRDAFLEVLNDPEPETVKQRYPV